MLAVVVTVPGSEVEVASDMLWALGVMAVEERPLDVDRSETDDGLVELWTTMGDDPHQVARAAEGFPSRWRWHTVEVDESVAGEWRRHAVPSWITPDLVVVPAWVEGPGQPGVTVVRIEPGSTFGLGDHPTTVLTLRAVSGVLWPDATVLDVGCGSGVLAIGAALLGASYVEAIDVAAAAVPTTEANAELNGVAAKIAVSNRPLAEVEGTFDVVCANILAPVLIDLAEQLRRVTSPSGVLVLSGVLEGAHDHVLEALAPMQVVDRLHREGWAAVVLRH